MQTPALRKKERTMTGRTNRSTLSTPELPLVNQSKNSSKRSTSRLSSRHSRSSAGLRSVTPLSPINSKPHTAQESDEVVEDPMFMTTSIINRKRETTLERLNTSLITRSMTKYKNFHDNFRDLDKNHDGKLQFDEFLNMVVSNGLDTEEHAKVLFDQFKDSTGNMPYKNFLKLLQSDQGGLNRMEYIPPVIKPVKLREDKEEDKKAHKRVDQIKDDLLYYLQQKMKIHYDKKNNSTVLYKAFKAMDRDHNGYLTYDILKKNLGPFVINKQLKDEEIEDLCRVIDHNHNGIISYCEWMSEMAEVDYEPGYDMLGPARERSVAALYKPLPEVYDPTNDPVAEPYPINGYNSINVNEINKTLRICDGTDYDLRKTKRYSPPVKNPFYDTTNMNLKHETLRLSKSDKCYFPDYHNSYDHDELYQTLYETSKGEMKTRHGATPVPPDTYYDLSLGKFIQPSPLEIEPEKQFITTYMENYNNVRKIPLTIQRKLESDKKWKIKNALSIKYKKDLTKHIVEDQYKKDVYDSGHIWVKSRQKAKYFAHVYENADREAEYAKPSEHELKCQLRTYSCSPESMFAKSDQSPQK